MDGVIVVNKEKDFTSFDVCAVMRGICKTKKIGHGGTLDPQAEGVLPVFVGNATKLCDFLPYEDKCYEAEMTLGLQTDTEDIFGEVLETFAVNVSEEEVRKAILSFKGTYDQVPPMYSAKKVNGKKLYELARNGKEIAREAVPVEIRNIEILDLSLPKVHFIVECGKGTYIRSLCRDIGEKLGCGAVMSALRRTRHGCFTIAEAHTLKEIERLKDEGRLKELLRPVESLFPETEKLTVNETGEKALKNGNLLFPSMLTPAETVAETSKNGGFVRVYDMDGTFIAIYAYSLEKACFKPEKMFLSER